MTQEDRCDLLITGGIVITVDEQRRILDPGAIAIRGEEIAAVGTVDELAGYKAKRTINCEGKLITPGFVDCHNHLFESMLRGVGEGMKLWPWLSQLMQPFGDKVTREEAVAAVTNCALEAIRNGTTYVVDNHYAPTDFETTLAVADAIASTGLRGAVARGMYGHPTAISDQLGFGVLDRTFLYSVDEEIDITRAAIEARPPGSPIEVWPCPENISYNPQELIIRAVELAREFGTRWHSHLAEDDTEQGLYREQFGDGLVEWLHEENLLEDGTFAHCIWLDDKDIELLGDSHSGIAHCPVSNQYLATGIMRLPDLRSAGAVVGLGSDGSYCGNQDLILAMHQAVLLQRVNTLDPTILIAEEALEMATIGGARQVGINAGQLEPGKRADLAIIGMDAPQARPFNNAIGHLVYNGRGSDVEMTIIGGQIVYEDGRCTMIDEAAVMEEVQARSDELFERLGINQFRSP
ncbi:MAG: amidohydrolase [Anaerolineales bacterium]|nr:amidohydrolase [Anaerolineales bacterium]